MADTEPLCGREWIQKNKDKHTKEEIASLSIEVFVDGKKLPGVKKLKKLMKGGTKNNAKK